MTKKTIYIAGKVTGNSDAKIQFKQAENKLKTLGYEVFNPQETLENLVEDLRSIAGKFTEKEYMMYLLHILTSCDGIYLLDNYKDSFGAMIEYYWSLKFNIPIINKQIEGGDYVKQRSK